MPKAGKSTRPIIINTTSLIAQIKIILKNNIDAFLEEKSFPTDRSQLSQFPKFQKSNDKLTFNLILNTDGVSPKQSTRATFWTVSFGIVELDRFRRGHHHNIALSSLISGPSKPPMVAWEHALTILKEEIRQMRNVGIMIGQYRFFLSSINGCIDLEVCFNRFEFFPF